MPYLTHKVTLRNFKFSKCTVPCMVQKAQPLVHILNILKSTKAEILICYVCQLGLLTYIAYKLTPVAYNM